MSYTINGQNSLTQKFIDLACNPQQNIIVKACAGSGKTWLLASRIVRTLIEGANHSQILAITFTKKAAQEMKQRVMDYLHNFSKINAKDLEQELLARGIKLTANNLTRARNLYFEILSSPYAFNISTFHVWFANLANLAPTSQIIHYSAIREDENILYEDAVKYFLSSPIYNNYQDIFSQFLQKWNIPSLISNKTVIEIWKQRNNIFGYIDYECLQKFAYPNDKFIQELKQKSLPSFEIPNIISDIINQTINLLKPNNKTCQDIAFAIEQCKDKNDISLIEEALLTSGNKIKSTRVKSLQSEFESLASQILQYYYDLYNQAFTHISKIFIYAYAYYKSINSTIDFNDLQTNAKFLLNQSDIAQYIWCRLDNKYKHILFDEFQDTDDTQWEIINSWLDAYGKNDEDKPKIFIVGDLKQAIYRFRGSNSNVFIQAVNYLKENYNAYILAAYNTRRCSQKVVNWINQGLCKDSDQNLNDDYLPHTTSQKNSLNDNCYCLDLTENNYESANQLSSIIKHLHYSKNIAYQDILVLTPHRNNWAEFEKELSKQHIPCKVNRHGGLLQTQEVYIFINLMRFLLNKNNDYAVFFILTSPVFNIKSEELLSIIKSHAKKDLQKDLSYWQILQIYTNESKEDNCINSALKIAIEKLLYILSVYKNYTPLDLMQFLYIELDIETNFSIHAENPQQLSYNLHEFLKLVLNFNAGRYPNLNNLLDFILKYQYTNYIKEAPNVGMHQNENAVSFDTIHGAKGLEYDAVILMESMHYKSFTASILKVNHNWIAGKSHMHKLVETRQFSWNVQQNEHDAEYKNLLYVAMTRAKKIFILGGINNKKEDNQIWYKRLTNLENTDIYDKIDKTELEKLMMSVQEKNIQDENNINQVNVINKNNLHKLDMHKIQIQPREKPSIGQEIGIMMHKLLELITQFNYKNDKYNVPTSKQAALWLKISKHRMFMLDLALEKIHNILNAKHLEHIFSPKLYLQAMNEKSFLYSGKIYRMDRIIQTLTQDWIIVDYKFGDEKKHLDEYRQQLLTYKKTLSKNFNVVKNSVSTLLINSEAEIIHI